MAELQSEHRHDQDETESTCCGGHFTRSTRWAPVSNILIWLDCYASLVSVLCLAHLEKFGQFMTYQKTIIAAHCRYADDGWVIYDSSYCRQTANIKSLDLRLIDGTRFLWGEQRPSPSVRFVSSSRLSPAKDSPPHPAHWDPSKGMFTAPLSFRPQRT